MMVIQGEIQIESGLHDSYFYFNKKVGIRFGLGLLFVAGHMAQASAVTTKVIVVGFKPDLAG